jgi:thiol-disulfide isomerase/thioredoxin
MKQHFLLFLFLELTTVRGFTQICIAGHIDNYQEKEKQVIHLYKPVHSVSQSWYSDPDDDIEIAKDGSFHRIFSISSIGSFSLTIMGKIGIDVDVQKNTDSFYIHFKEDSGTYSLIDIGGDNGSGNILICKMLREIDRRMNLIKYDSSGLDKIWNYITQVDAIYKNQALALKESKRITESFYFYLENNIESEMLFALYSHYLNFKIPDNKVKLFLDSAYKRYYPFRQQYLVASEKSLTNAYYYIKFIKKGGITLNDSIISPPDPNWQEIDSISYATCSENPKTFREDQLASFILMGIYFHSPTVRNAIILFSKKYPSSEYNSLFLRILLPKKYNSSAMTILDTSLDKTVSNKDIIFLSDSMTLQGIINKYFKGRMVLIDNWATWCSPCIAEFPYVKDAEIDSFFAANRIGKLYISWDQGGMIKGWKPVVGNFSLKGVHTLINDGLKNDILSIAALKKSEVLPLPRFILIGPDGKVISTNFRRPSDRRFLDSLNYYMKKMKLS